MGEDKQGFAFLTRKPLEFHRGSLSTPQLILSSDHLLTTWQYPAK
jgi:hypothetical protein